MEHRKHRPRPARASQAPPPGKSHRPTDGPSTRAGSAPCRSSTASSAGSASARRCGDRLPREDRRWRVSNTAALLLLAKNLLVAREPLYGVGEWAARHEPSWLGLSENQLAALNDDRVGRALDRLFDADVPSLVLDIAAHAVREFDVESRRTSQRFHHRHLPRRLRLRRARTHPPRPVPGRHHLGPQQGPQARLETTALHSHSDRRRRRAGAVPRPERQHHRRSLPSRHLGLPPETHRPADFLYVADCKLATTENMAYIHKNGGRFVTVLPRTRGEDAAFRATVQAGAVVWRQVHVKAG